MANEFKVKHGLIVNGSGSTVLDIQGSQGQLFSITDSLSGSLFSVGDISGIPILEVFSDDTVKIGSYNNEAIVVSGSHATVSGSFSGSFVGDGSGLTGISIAGIISESAQVDHDQTTNFSADEHFTQANITTVGTVTSGDVSGILPAGTISGSTQVVASLINQDLDLGTGDITAVSGTFDHLTANDRLQLGGAGSQFFAYNEDTVKVKFANWYSSNDRQYGMGQLWYETWFAAIDDQAGRENRRIGFYLEVPDSGSSDADGGTGGHPSNARFYVDVDGAYLSGSLNVENSITASYFKGDGSALTGIINQSGDFVANELIVATGTNSVTSSNILSLDTANNYLGINQTSPEVTLHMTGDGAQTAQIRMEQFNDTADAPDIRTRKARGTSAAPSAPAAGDYLFRQNIERYNGTGYSTMHSQQFDLDSSDATKAVYQLQTDIGSGLATRYSIDASSVHSFTGNVKVAGTISGSSSITGSDVKIDDWGSVSASLATISASAASGGTTPTLQQVTDQGATTTNNIGIGTTSPAAALDVNGDAFIQNNGSLLASGSGYLRTGNDNGGTVLIGGDGSISYIQAQNNRLVLQTSRAEDDIEFKVGESAATSSMFIDGANGRIGIGTTTPSADLDIEDATGVTIDVNSSSGDGLLRFQDAGVTKWFIGRDNTNQNFVFSSGSGLGNGNLLTLTTSGEVGVNTSSPAGVFEVQTVDSNRNVRFKSPNGEERFEFYTGGSGNPADLYLYDADGTTKGIGLRAGTSNSYISDGNLGIGTTTPQAKLHVEGIITGSSNLDIQGAAYIRGGNINIQDSDDPTTTHVLLRSNGTEGVLRAYNGSNYGFIANGFENTPRIGTWKSGSIFICGFTDTNGDVVDDTLTTFKLETKRVGIRTTSPTETLDVRGNADISGSLSLSATGAELQVGTSQKGYIGVGTQADYSANFTSEPGIGINTVHIVGDGSNRLKVRNSSNSAYATVITNNFSVVNGGGLTTSNNRTFLTLSETTGNTAAIGAIGTSTDGDYALKVFSTENNAPLLVGSGSNNYMIVSSSGNIGIGTTAPSEKLHVAGNIAISGSNATLQLRESSAELYKFTAGGSSLDMTVDATNAISIFQTGDVGIGTTTPSYNLDVSGSGNFTDGLTVTGSILHDGDLTVTGTVTAQEFHTEFVSASIIYESGSTKFGDTSDDIHSFSGSFRISGSGDHYFTDGNVGIGVTAPSQLLDVAGNINLDGDNRHIYFSNTNVYIGELSNSNKLELRGGGSTQTQTAYLDSSGNLGLGVSSPTQKLDVRGSLIVAGDTPVSPIGADLEVYKNGSTAKLLIHQDDSTASSTFAQVSFRNGGNDTHIKVPPTGNGLLIDVESKSEAFTISTTGDVGIGTTSPDEKLNVSGSVRVDDGELYVTRDGSSRKSVRLHQTTDKGAITLQRDGVDNVNISSDQVNQGHTYFNGSGVNVGIGTTSPPEKLTVEGNISGSGTINVASSITGSDVKIDDWGSVSASLASINTSAGTGAGNLSTGSGTTLTAGQILLADSSLDASGSQNLRFGSGVLTINNATVGGIDAYAMDLADALLANEITASAGIRLNDYNFPTADGTSGQAITTDGNGNLSFSTVSSGGTTISNDANNRVTTGLGTGDLNAEANLTFDGSKLSVGKTTATSPLHVYQNDTNTGTATGITVEQDGTGDAVVQYLLTGGRRWVTGIDNDDSDKFKIASTSGLGSNDRLTIDTSGNVGIGTINPGVLLDVAGDISSSGTLYVANDLDVDQTGSFQELQVNKIGGAKLRISAASAGKASLLLGANTTGGIGEVFTTTATDLQLGTNSTALIHLDHTNSNVGIGTTTPNSDYKLQVDGPTFVNSSFYSKNALTSSLIKLPENDSGLNGEVLVSDGNGNMSFTSITGIGGYSAPPTDAVTYTGTPTDNQLAVFTDGDTVEGDSNLTWDGTNLNINGSGSFEHLTVETPSPGTSKLQIVQSGTGGTDLDFQPQSGLAANIQTINATDLRLGTNSTSLIHLDNANSNVGIGTTNPSSTFKLDVSGDMRVVNSSATNTRLTVAGNTAGSPIIQLTPGTTGTQSGSIVTTNAKDFKLGVNNEPYITIQGSTGNVGINQTNPIEELDVDGNIAVTGFVTGSFYNGISALGAGTTHSIDLSTAQVFTKTLTADTQFYFSNYKTGVVKDLIVSGNHDLVFNTSQHDEINIIGAASYDGTQDNLIQVLCTDDSSNGKFWLTISRT